MSLVWMLARPRLIIRLISNHAHWPSPLCANISYRLRQTPSTSVGALALACSGDALEKTDHQHLHPDHRRLPPLYIHPHHIPAMASRRLAFSLQQGLRAQRAINAVKPKPGLTRSLATPVSHGSTTESTTLSNGFTVRAPIHSYTTRHQHIRKR